MYLEKERLFYKPFFFLILNQQLSLSVTNHRFPTPKTKIKTPTGDV